MDSEWVEGVEILHYRRECAWKKNSVYSGFMSEDDGRRIEKHEETRRETCRHIRAGCISQVSRLRARVANHQLFVLVEIGRKNLEKKKKKKAIKIEVQVQLALSVGVHRGTELNARAGITETITDRAPDGESTYRATSVLVLHRHRGPVRASEGYRSRNCPDQRAPDLRDRCTNFSSRQTSESPIGKLK